MVVSADFIKEINDAVGAHGAWKLKLKTAIALGSSDVTPVQVGCDDRCAFGKWIHGPTIDARTRSGMPYQVVRRLHAEFHQSAAQVLAEALRGRKAEASALLEGEYRFRSEKLVLALSKWKGELAQIR